MKLDGLSLQELKNLAFGTQSQPEPELDARKLDPAAYAAARQAVAQPSSRGVPMVAADFDARTASASDYSAARATITGSR